MYLDKLKAELRDLNLIPLNDFIPCSQEEVHVLEEQLGLRLPEAYKEFLLWMGHGAGPLLRGSDCFYKDVPHLKRWAVELLEENSFSEPLPDDAFVFFMHQGYQFAFLWTSEGNDPPVYYYNETIKQNSFTVAYNSFSEFLATEIEVHAKPRNI